jgi:FMN phosphatase YigB (HAD superfamily)
MVEIKPPLNQEPTKITDLVVDADNTLWDWVAMHAPGMEAMAELLSRRLQIKIEEVRASMARVYKMVAALDFDGLVQNMDVVYKGVIDKNLKSYGDSAAAAWAGAQEFNKLAGAVKDEYQFVRKQNLRLYPGVRELFEVLNTRVRIHILTDAPADKAISRIKQLGIEKYLTSLFGQPELNPSLSDGGGGDESFKNVQRQVNGHVVDHQHEERVRRGDYSVPFNRIDLYGQRKPKVDLARLLNKTRDEVAQCVAVWGDSPKADMGLAANNNCLGFFAAYGQPSQEHIDILNRFGNPKGVNRDIDSDDPEITKIREVLGNRLIKIQDPIEILGHLGVEQEQKK